MNSDITNLWLLQILIHVTAKFLYKPVESCSTY